MEPKLTVYFVACCFPPFGRGNAITNSCVANHLADSCDVVVVCMQREEGGVIAYQEDRSLADALNPRLRIHRIRAANWRGLNIALYAIGALPCYYLNWAWRVWRRRKDLFALPGAVFAVYPVFSDLVVGYLVSRRCGFPLLVDFRDDFSGVMARGWRGIWGPLYRWLEKRIVSAADGISVTTETLRQDLLHRYDLAPNKVQVVYNIVPPTPATDAQEPERVSGSTRIIYAGAMSQVQKPEILLRAYAQLQQRDATWAQRLQVELYGPESPYFLRNIKKLLTPGSHFGGFLPQAEMAKRVAHAELGFFSLSDATFAYATPTKLFDYIEAGVPIVASLPLGAARELVERWEIGLVADCGDVKGLADCLQRMADDEKLRQRYRDNMRSIREQLRPQIQVGKWIKMLQYINLKQLSGELDEKPSSGDPGAQTTR